MGKLLAILAMLFVGAVSQPLLAQTSSLFFQKARDAVELTAMADRMGFVRVIVGFSPLLSQAETSG
jgi:hypothetical protein